MATLIHKIVDGVAVPCLQRDLDPNEGPHSYRDLQTYAPLQMGSDSWYYDQLGLELIEKDAKSVYLRTLHRKDPIEKRVFFVDVVEPSLSMDEGYYLQRCHESEECPFWFVRVNPYPTVYLNIIASKFLRSIGRAVVDLYPELLCGDKFVEGSTWPSKGATVWIYRRSRSKMFPRGWHLEHRPEESYADLTLTGELATAVARIVSRLIRDRQFPFKSSDLEGLLPEFWDGLQYRLRRHSIRKSYLPNEIPWFSLGDTDCLESIRYFAYHAKDLYLLNDLVREVSQVSLLAEEAWDLANSLLILKSVIQKSKEENCLDTSVHGRMAIACRFARSARERIRKIQGKEYRDCFDSESWIENYGKVIIQDILRFQLRNPGVLFHIDHIVPLAALPPESWRDHDALAWHPCNLQLLPAEENVRKGSFYLGKRLTHKKYDLELGLKAVGELERRFFAYRGSSEASKGS